MSDAQRQAAAKAGTAMPGGRFPIKSVADLHNAVMAVGRAKGGAAGQAAVRRFIMKRAHEMGAMDQVPASWNADGTLK